MRMTVLIIIAIAIYALLALVLLLAFSAENDQVLEVAVIPTVG